MLRPLHPHRSTPKRLLPLLLATGLLLRGIMVLLPLRAGEGEERTGLDVPLHGEEAYTSGEGAILVIPSRREKPLKSVSAALEVAEGSS